MFLSEIVVYENCPLWNYTSFGNGDELLLETVKGKREREKERIMFKVSTRPRVKSGQKAI